MPRATRPPLLFVLAVLLLVGAATPAVAGPGAHPIGNATTNNTTHHENPDTVSGNGNDAQVRGWLSARMARMLENSSIQLSEGQYQQAHEMLGHEYTGYLGKYVDVNGPTAETRQTSENFNETRSLQQEYAQTAQQYNETYTKYRQARQNGNDSKARQLAHKLTKLSTRLNATSQNLTQHYTHLENGTGISFANATQNVKAPTANITAQTAAVVNATFRHTTLTVSTSASTASFGQPATLTGRLTTENDTAISGPVTLRVGHHTLRATLDSGGRFTIPYRPLLERTGSKTITVAYQPGATTPYLASKGQVSLEVTQTPSTITVDSSPTTVRFQDTFLVQGRLRANNTSVPGVPVRITVGGLLLGETQTTANGTYHLRVQTPAALSAGTESVTAAVAVQNRSLGPSNATTALTVASTPTSLTIHPDWTNGALRITGKLETTGGTPIQGQTVDLSANGTTLASIQTNADGSYHATIQASSLPDAGSLRLVSAFDGHASNLQSTRATTTATPPAPSHKESQSNSIPREVRDNLFLFVGIAALVLLGIAGAFYWYRRSTTTPTTSTEREDSQNSTAVSERGEAWRAADAISDARSALDAGETTDAVIDAYTTVRARLPGTSASLTHWEFERKAATTAGLTDAQRDHLRILTEQYETAAFSPTPPTPDHAEDAIDAAATLLKELNKSSSSDD